MTLGTPHQGGDVQALLEGASGQDLTGFAGAIQDSLDAVQTVAPDGIADLREGSAFLQGLNPAQQQGWTNYVLIGGSVSGTQPDGDGFAALTSTLPAGVFEDAVYVIAPGASHNGLHSQLCVNGVGAELDLLVTPRRTYAEGVTLEQAIFLVDGPQGDCDSTLYSEVSLRFAPDFGLVPGSAVFGGHRLSCPVETGDEGDLVGGTKLFSDGLFPPVDDLLSDPLLSQLVELEAPTDRTITFRVLPGTEPSFCACGGEPFIGVERVAIVSGASAEEDGGVLTISFGR